jgi:hypothetical protein
MEKSILQIIFEKSIEQGHLTGRLFSYSGRAMYGRTCVAYEPGDEDPGLLATGAILYEQALTTHPEHADELVSAMSRERTDSMGLGIVVYWPAEAWSEEDDDERL